MTAGELIAELSELDPDTDVFVSDTGCGCCAGGAVQASLSYRETWVDDGYTGVSRTVWIVE